MDSSQQILVTGSAGAVGRIVCRALVERGHRVRGFDRVASPGGESVVGSITDPEALERAMAGCTTVAHLAATPDEADFMTELLPNNIVGVYQVLEAARRASVERVILTSSVQTIGGMRLPKDRSLRLSDGTSPHNAYAVSKLFAENMGHMFVLRCSMTVIAARLGWMPRGLASLEHMRGRISGQAIYVSHRDAGRFYVAAVEAPVSGYHLMYATSKPPVGAFGPDPEPARLALGYEAVDTYPDGCTFT